MGIRITGRRYIGPNATLQVQRSGYAVRSVLLTAGAYFIDVAQPDDLLDMLQSQVRAAGGELSGFSVGIDGAGRVQITMPAGQSTTLTWATDEAREVRDWLRFAGNLTINPSSVAPRTHEFGFYPTHHVSALTDLHHDEMATSQSQSDNRATIETVVFGEAKGWLLELGCKGSPFASVEAEYHQLRDCVSWMTQGHAFRYYRDVAVLDPWAELSAPLGYSTLKLDAADFDWKVQPASGNYYKHWRKRLLCWEAT